MKAGITTQELAVRVSNVISARRDLIVPTDHITYSHNEDTNELHAQVNEDDEPTNLTMSKLFAQQVGQRLQLPAAYYGRLEASDRHLLAYSLNRLNRAAPERRLIRTLSNGTQVARAYLSDKYRRLDNEEVLEQVLPALGAIPGLTITECELTEHRMYIKAVTDKVAGEVKKNDPVQAGVIISNSEVGAGALSISPLVYRLVCLNGMILPDSRFRAFHIGKRAEESEGVYAMLTDETKAADDRAILLKARDVAASIFNQAYFDGLLTKMRESTGQQAETKRPDKAVEVLARQVGLNGTEQISVLTHLLKGGDFSRWGFANAVTAMAQEVPSYDRSVHLEQVGSHVMMLPAKEWKAVATADA